MRCAVCACCVRTDTPRSATSSSMGAWLRSSERARRTGFARSSPTSSVTTRPPSTLKRSTSSPLSTAFTSSRSTRTCTCGSSRSSIGRRTTSPASSTRASSIGTYQSFHFHFHFRLASRLTRPGCTVAEITWFGVGWSRRTCASCTYAVTGAVQSMLTTPRVVVFADNKNNNNNRSVRLGITTW